MFPYDLRSIFTGKNNLTYKQEMKLDLIGPMRISVFPQFLFLNDRFWGLQHVQDPFEDKQKT